MGLLSRRAMLPLIVFSILFGFAVQMTGGKDPTADRQDGSPSLSDVMMKFVQIVTYYAPIAFFGHLRRPGGHLRLRRSPRTTAGPWLVYYPLCFIYIFTAFPLFAWFGGGKGAVKDMFRHIARPAITSLGTCSSVATIPTNMEEAEETGITKDVSRDGAASGRHHAHGRLLLLLRAEDCVRAAACSASTFSSVRVCPSSFWWLCCPPWA